MLKLSDQGFKTTVITTLRVLVDKVDSMQECMSNMNRDGSSKKDSKGNDRKEKTTILKQK